MSVEIRVSTDAQKIAATRDLLDREFPTVNLSVGERRSVEPFVRASEWRRRHFDVWAFDRRVDQLASAGLPLLIEDDGDDPRFALHVLNRCQRWIGRRNASSEGERFDSVLQIHRRLHDLARPLVRADYDHALDVWQWALRLDGNASFEVQVAALFHDIERLESEAERRIEHLAPDYQQFKQAHARGGAAIASAALSSVDAAFDRVAELIARHEARSEDRDVILLNDADALSFLSFNSPGYADYFDAEQTRKKLAYTIRRMSARALAKLDLVYLRPDVRELFDEVVEERGVGERGAAHDLSANVSL